MSYRLYLDGCAPAPLAHYLKALGVLRLVAEQRDAAATGCWEGDRFVLASRLDRDALLAFLLEAFRPTPLVAPWNGGSGFYPKDNQTGISAIERSATPRLAPYRAALAAGREALRQEGITPDLEKKELERLRATRKAAIVVRLRAELDDAALAWLDAAVLLAGEEPRYPPLLGTGGNDGRLDFTNNYMQRLAELFDTADGTPRPEAVRWLPGALFGEATSLLTGKAVGQFFPGAAGGPNAGTGFEGGNLVNPWDYLLMLEGALLFAAVATRRLGDTAPGALAYPFSVRVTGAGTGASAHGDESQGRAEVWMPLWERPCGLAELRTLLGEGRATLGRHPARDGLDFVRAVAALGVDRGIAAFQRYGFLMRSGKAYLATPMGRVQVRRNAHADLIADLDRNGFLERLRRLVRSDTAPARLAGLVRRLEDRLFDLAQHAGPPRVQRVLETLGDIVRALAASPAGREAVPILPALSAQWVQEADDGSDEYRLAVALAGLQAQDLAKEDDAEKPVVRDNMPLRPFLVPVNPDPPQRRWQEGSRLAVWAGGDLVSDMLRVLERRLLEAERRGLRDKPLAGTRPADPGAIAAFLAGETDDRRIARLVPGLALAWVPGGGRSARHVDEAMLPAAFALLAPFFTPDRVLQEARVLPADRHLPLPLSLVQRLAAGHVDRAVALAWQRARAAGLSVPAYPRRPPDTATLSGPRLAAALLFPLRGADVARLFQRVSGAQTLHRPTETQQGDTL